MESMSENDFECCASTGVQPYPYQAEIYVMNVDVSNLRRLTTSSAMSGSPAWSCDGRTLFFYSDREGGRFRIWAMDADGNGGTQSQESDTQPGGRFSSRRFPRRQDGCLQQ